MCPEYNAILRRIYLFRHCGALIGLIWICFWVPLITGLSNNRSIVQNHWLHRFHSDFLKQIHLQQVSFMEIILGSTVFKTLKELHFYFTFYNGISRPPHGRVMPLWFQCQQFPISRETEQMCSKQ